MAKLKLRCTKCGSKGYKIKRKHQKKQPDYQMTFDEYVDMIEMKTSAILAKLRYQTLVITCDACGYEVTATIPYGGTE